MYFGKIIIIAFCSVTPCSLGEMLYYIRQESVYFIMHDHRMAFGRGVNSIADKTSSHC